MNWDSLISTLKAERDRINAVLDVLEPRKLSEKDSAEIQSAWATGEVRPTGVREAVFTPGDVLSIAETQEPEPEDGKPDQDGLVRRFVKPREGLRREDAGQPGEMGPSEAILQAVRELAPALSTPIIDRALQLRPSAERRDLYSSLFYLKSKGKLRKDDDGLYHLGGPPPVETTASASAKLSVADKFLKDLQCV